MLNNTPYYLVVDFIDHENSENFPLQISEDITGPPPTDNPSIVDESNWIYTQLSTNMLHLFGKDNFGTQEEVNENELPISKDDITRFLDLMHVKKYDVSNGC